MALVSVNLTPSIHSMTWWIRHGASRSLWWTNILPWKDPPIFNGKIHDFYGKITILNGKIHDFYGKITIFNGKIHDFYGHFQSQTVSSPEGSWGEWTRQQPWNIMKYHEIIGEKNIWKKIGLEIMECLRCSKINMFLIRGIFDEKLLLFRKDDAASFEGDNDSTADLIKRGWPLMAIGVSHPCCTFLRNVPLLLHLFLYGIYPYNPIQMQIHAGLNVCWWSYIVVSCYIPILGGAWRSIAGCEKFLSAEALRNGFR